MHKDTPSSLEHLTDDEWRARLSPEQYHVLRESGTEAPFTGKYVNEKNDGMYHCAACGEPVFSSKTKYDSGSGWPSFTDSVSDGSVVLHEDTSLGMQRVEVVCGNCGSHLGHVFDDGPLEMPDGSPGSGKRYCINSISLDLKEG